MHMQPKQQAQREQEKDEDACLLKTYTRAWHAQTLPKRQVKRDHENKKRQQDVCLLKAHTKVFTCECSQGNKKNEIKKKEERLQGACFLNARIRARYVHIH